MALARGTRLGPYEIGAQIGVDSMGVAYRATDTNLKRAIAIKVLPEAVTFDGERLTCFQREAEVLASLQSSEHRANLRTGEGRWYPCAGHGTVMLTKYEATPANDYSGRRLALGIIGELRDERALDLLVRILSTKLLPGDDDPESLRTGVRTEEETAPHEGRARCGLHAIGPALPQVLPCA